ncbi:AMIN domain-containing protein [Desulfovibrio sp.]|uniref:AMIN domain-containing protein n=1 Tax=Desulfovibrio sp. TaxID=885 RepID=UPI0025B8491A|nr:AMIN domain-containing protein [Desulfovibrio sp.]
MNKVILSLLLAVCVLGMALIMLNERLRKPEQPSITQTTIGSQAADAAAGLPEVQDADPGALLPGPDSRPLASGGTAEPYLPPLPVESAHSLTPPDRASRPDAEMPRAADSATVRAPLPEPVKHSPAPSSTAGKTPVSPQAEAGTKSAAPTQTPPAATPEKTQPAEKKIPERATAEKPAPKKLEITRFVVFARDKGATIRLVGTAPIEYKSMTLNNPERLVIDIEGKWQIKAPGVPKNPLVTNVRLGKFADKTRVVIDLSGKAAHTRYILSKDKMSLDIRVDQ